MDPVHVNNQAVTIYVTGCKCAGAWCAGHEQVSFPAMNFSAPAARPCGVCGRAATVAYGYGWGGDHFACDEHNPMRSAAGAIPAGFWLRSMVPLPPFVPWTTGGVGA